MPGSYDTLYGRRPDSGRSAGAGSRAADQAAFEFGEARLEPQRIGLWIAEPFDRRGETAYIADPNKHLSLTS